MTFTLRPHEYRTDKRTGKHMLVRALPYIRLRNGDEPPVFIQEGTFYTESGDKIETPPAWVHSQLENVTDRAKREVGLDPEGD